MVGEYKDSDDFVNDATKGRKGMHFFGFTDCKNMVAQAYPALDPSNILASREEGPMDGEEEVVKEKAIGKNILKLII